MVYAEFGGQTECIMGDSKIENSFPGITTSPVNNGNHNASWDHLRLFYLHDSLL